MGLSTTLAIYDMQEKILENLEKGFITCIIFCDLSKAFDTIDHDVLLWKLNNFFGIKGLPLKLLASYLQGRQQYTVIDGCTQGRSQTFSFGGPLEGPVLQQGELSMVCVGLSERVLLQWHDVTRKILGGPLGGQAKFLGGQWPPWHPPSSAPGCTSATLNITQGVPQGSSLGPLLFAFI